MIVKEGTKKWRRDSFMEAISAEETVEFLFDLCLHTF